MSLKHTLLGAGSVALGCALLSTPQARASTSGSSGLFIVINPYDKSCTQGGEGYDWLYQPKCQNTADQTQVKNNIPDLIKNGDVSGIFLNVRWDAYEQDGTPGNRAQFEQALNAVEADAPNTPVSITVGMIAGVYTACDVMIKSSGYLPVWSPEHGGQCDIMPTVYNTYPNGTNGDAFANAYVSIVQDVVNQVNISKQSNPLLALTALKLGGLDTDYSELHITGDNSQQAPPNGQTLGQKVCSVPLADIQAPCTPGNTGGLDWYTEGGYYPTTRPQGSGQPTGVEKTWVSIYGGLYSIAQANGLILELDAIQSNSFPPIAIGQDVNNPQFNCTPYGTGSGQCLLYSSGGGQPLPPPSSFIGLHFTKNYLLPDLFSAVPPQSLALQLDGLKFDGTNYQPLTAQQGYNAAIANQPPEPGINGVPIPCWAYYNDPKGSTIVGFQTATGQQFDANTYTNYTAALQYGLAFGASYIELHPADVNSFVNADPIGTSNAGSKLSGINQGLKAVAGNPNCQWSGH